MSKPLQTILLGTSVLAGVVSLSTPSWGASLSSVSTSGEITVFAENSNHVTYEVPNTPQNLINALGGTATAAGGNIELNNTIDNGWSNTHLSTLKASFSDQRSIVFSSLTQNDWFNNGLANQWYSDAYKIYASQFNTLAASVSLSSTNTTQVVTLLNGLGVFQRLSDPNVAYVSDQDGEFTFGLAGHQNLATGLQIPTTQVSRYALFSSMYASEVIKYSLDNGNSWKYAYSFTKPINSGVVGSDGFSHTGTFEFTVGSRAVPEASNALAVGVLGGLLALKQGYRMLKKA